MRLGLAIARSRSVGGLLVSLAGPAVLRAFSLARATRAEESLGAAVVGEAISRESRVRPVGVLRAPADVRFVSSRANRVVAGPRLVSVVSPAFRPAARR